MRVTVEQMLDVQSALLRYASVTWSAHEWFQFYAGTLTCGPCGKPCSCVVEHARQQLRPDAPALVHDLHTKIGQAIDAVAVGAEEGQRMVDQTVAVAEQYANDKPPF
ncbi:MAG: hypothetical protein Q4F65_11280 [Propionibacteriaceae bacterium]|nr:hypothetical protein [Propionibacteriaceae bacterium]